MCDLVVLDGHNIFDAFHVPKDGKRLVIDNIDDLIYFVSADAAGYTIKSAYKICAMQEGAVPLRELLVCG